MSKRLAVIDLGTNTFHLVIVEAQANRTFKTLYRKRFFVKLAEKGIQTIGKAALERGMEALSVFKATLEELKVDIVKAIGTAALRTASNGPSFILQVQNKLGINIELISGEEEAAYIHKGIALAIPFQAINYLLMDIGGGSVEFIIANKDHIYWAKSFPIGVGVLHKKFHKHDPITNEEVQVMWDFFNTTLLSLQKATEDYPFSVLVGAAGTFDVLENALAKTQHDTYAYVDIEDFSLFHTQLLTTTLKARYARQDIPDQRVDMIVVATVLIDYILKTFKIKQIMTSKYAMKEGVLATLI